MISVNNLKFLSTWFFNHKDVKGIIEIGDVKKDTKGEYDIVFRYVTCSDPLRVDNVCTFHVNMSLMDIFEPIVTDKFKVGDLVTSEQGNFFTVTGFEVDNNRVIVHSKKGDKQDRRRYSYKINELAVCENKKLCRIINGQFSWILCVDGQEITFSLGSSADYFEQHYKQLGYTVVRN